MTTTMMMMMICHDVCEHTEGVRSMMEAMASAGVAGAMLCGCPLKKHWSEYEVLRRLLHSG